jgi:3-oxoacyl-[acyl-carrier-protein] synthase II
MISDIACGHISKYGFRGPNFATVSACASSQMQLLTLSLY